MKNLIFLSMLCSLTAVAASKLYKSVDEQGRITFSDSPPAAGGQVQTVDLPSEAINIMPSEGLQEEIQRQKKVDQKVALRRASEQKDWSRRQREARDALAEAELNLEGAREVREGDTVGSAFGGARPNQAWIQRLEQAEADVEGKRHQLNKIQAER